MRRLAVLTALILSGCSGGSPADEPAPFTGPPATAGIALRNATATPLVYVAAGEGALALLDIRPTLFPGEYESRLVGPGRTVPVAEIIGYDPALGVTFYLYLVDPGSGEARYSGFFVASAPELSRNDGLVTVTDTRL